MPPLIISFLSLYGHIYILASLLQPDETLVITLRLTRQLQDELALYKSKIAAATREADTEYLDGSAVLGSFRFIKSDARAKIQTTINAATLCAHAFILLSILLISTLVDGFKFYRHIVDSNARSLTTKQQKILKYLSKQPTTDATHHHQPVVTFAEPAAAYISETEDEHDEDVTSSFRSESNHFTWFKSLFSSTNNTTTNNKHHPSLTSIDVTPAILSSKMEKQNEWNDVEEESSNMPTHASNSHTTTLFIGQNDNDNDTNTWERKNTISSSSSSPPPPSLSLSSPSPSSSISKSSLSTTTATNKSFFFIKKKRQSSIGKKASSPPILPSSPPRPLAIYSEQPFTTSHHALITTSSQMSYPLGSSLSLKLRQPGRRLSLLFRKKTKNKKSVMQY